MIELGITLGIYYCYAVYEGLYRDAHHLMLYEQTAGSNTVKQVPLPFSLSKKSSPLKDLIIFWQ